MNDSQKTPRMSRRTALGLGLLGASALTIGGALVMPKATRASTPAGSSAPLGPVPPSLRPGGEFDQFVRQLAAQDQFSGTVLLAYRGRPILSRAYGMADKALSVPNTLTTRFALASVTKAMTAAAVLQLAQQGALDLSATLGTYLSGFPAETANAVTIHQMLTMTSGLGNYYIGTDWQQQAGTWTTPSQVLDGTLAFIQAQQLLFTPGTQYSYSNSGFVVLGAIVQEVSGLPYWDYMRQHVFSPARMTRTDFYTRPQVLALNASHEVAHPYAAQKNGGRVDVFDTAGKLFIGLPDGAGGPYTTAPDMLSFASALQDGTLLDQARARQMLDGKFPVTPSMTTNPSVPPDVARTWQSWMIGYGLEDTIINDQHVLGHSGAGPGISTGLDIYPDLDWVAVVLENYDLTPFGANFETSSIAVLERRLITEQTS